MNLFKTAAVMAIVLPLAACGAGGHVGSNADRGSADAVVGQNLEVVTRARASDFVKSEGTSTRVSTKGVAEIIYSERRGSGSKLTADRMLIANRDADAITRALAVSGCRSGLVDYQQHSIQGHHVIVRLEQCPAMTASSILNRNNG